MRNFSLRCALKRLRRDGHRKRRSQLQSRSSRLELLESRCLLAITVDTLADEMDNSINDGDISLRDAIALAPAGETINFSVPGTIHLDLGQIIVDKALTISGPGASQLTIQAKSNDVNVDGDGDRIFSVEAFGESVSISGLTLTGGDPWEGGGAIRAGLTNLVISDTVITGNVSASGGGLEFGGGGAYGLVIKNSRFENNLARLGQGNGGGVFADVQGNATLQISDSEFLNNTAYFQGGGLRIEGGNFTSDGDQIAIRDSVISGNTCGGEPNGYLVGLNGGGLSVDMGNRYGGRFLVERSTIADNRTMGSGAGLWIATDIIYSDPLETVRIDSTTISGNVAFGAVGVTGVTGILDGGGGLALNIIRAIATVVNSTVSGNRAINGGGIFIGGSYGGSVASPKDVRIQHSTIAFNKAGPFDSAEYDDVPGDSQIQRVTGGGGVLFASGVEPLPLITDPPPYAMPTFDHTIIAGNIHVQNEPPRFDPPHTHESWNYSPDLGATPLPEDFQLVENFDTALDNSKFNLISKYSIIGSAQNYPLWNVWGIVNTESLIGVDGLTYDAMLDPNLQDNGGPTLTHALLPGSPAIDAGDPGFTSPPSEDQRSYERVVDGNNDTIERIDIGAYEYLAEPVCNIDGDYNDNGVVDAADYSVWRDHLGQAFQLANEEPSATPGMVTIEDYDVWKMHFGETCDGMGHAAIVGATTGVDGGLENAGYRVTRKSTKVAGSADAVPTWTDYLDLRFLVGSTRTATSVHNVAGITNSTNDNRAGVQCAARDGVLIAPRRYDWPNHRHSLVSTSPAIDANTSSDVDAYFAHVVLFDQQDLSRVVDWDELGGERFDIGAVELAFAETYAYSISS